MDTGYTSVGYETRTTGSGGGALSSHTHSYMGPYHDGSGYGRHYHIVYADLSHSHGMSHTHNIKIGSHTHSVTISAHSHSVSIPGHTHTVTIKAHKHTVSIPDHAHDITQGIFEFGSPTAASLYINGVRKAGIGKDAELDITQYLVEDGSIPRGRWHKIELVPDDLAYITIDITVQGFVQSRGDNTV